MRHPKATRAAAPRAHDPRRVDPLGGKIDAEAAPDIIAMQSVYVGSTCIGFVYLRGPQGVEAFDADCHSLGLFPDTKVAADMVTAAAQERAR
jgi:hypothetical protein